MRGFITEVADALYRRYGDDISSLRLVFPNRRAQLFFCDALSSLIHRPLWQPAFVSIGELMERLSGLRGSDRVKLITELYKVYSRVHDESFDTFYFWGDMLLADFDQIDKYLIDADMLFSNIGDLKALEGDHSYLTDDQIRVIRQFWQSFGSGSSCSDEQRHFLTIWKSLADIYHRFRESLSAQGLAYEGMVYRAAAEKLLDDEAVALPGDADGRYVVVGFNALSACEKRLFNRLKKSGRAEFYWDYDSYYVDHKDYEAGMFLRDNIRDYPPPPEARIGHDHFGAPKETVVVPAPSDALQCKYVHTFLQELIDRGETPDKETAIVLTDESLLLPVLYAVPGAVDQLNITMGYPLRQTTAYSFVERLIGLQGRKRVRSGNTWFYHNDALGLLEHPYIRQGQPEIASALADGIRRSRSVYVRSGLFEVGGTIGQVFRTTGSWQSLSDYIRGCLAHVVAQPAGEGQEDAAQRREFFTVIDEHLVRIVNSLADSGLEIPVPVFASLLRRTLQTLRVPYEGEPLAGVQIMGILETRNLDFKNVLILSVNDDTFPGNRAVSSSFIPYNLRYAYGLPTPQHHEGVYAYYFYRLIQRAERVHLVYCSRSDDKRTGEPSRYIYQLEYESPHKPVYRPIRLGVNLSARQPLSVDKTGRVADALRAYLDGGQKRLSPTSFYHYVECPLKFYFRSVAGLSPQQEIAEEVDLPMFGTILHRTMELLYAPLLGDPAAGPKIGALVGSAAVKAAVQRAINEEYLRDEGAGEEEYGGNLILVRDVVAKYVNSCILPYDASQTGFVMRGLEVPVSCPFGFEEGNREHTVVFAGKSDRIDLLADGLLRVVDYKTGKRHIRFKDLESLFFGDIRERSAAVLQTLLYSLMLTRSEKCDVQPALYYVRNMQEPDFSPLLLEGNTPVVRFSEYRAEFEGLLRRVLIELFDLSKPFVQCSRQETCAFCDFREICRR